MPDLNDIPEQDDLDSVDIYNGNLSYGIAVLQANLGKRIRRAAWREDETASNTFVFYAPNNSWKLADGLYNKTIHNAKHSGFLIKFNKLGSLIPYIPGNEDVLAEDWELIDPEEEMF